MMRPATAKVPKTYPKKESKDTDPGDDMMISGKEMGPATPGSAHPSSKPIPRYKGLNVHVDRPDDFAGKRKGTAESDSARGKHASQLHPNFSLQGTGRGNTANQPQPR